MVTFFKGSTPYVGQKWRLGTGFTITEDADGVQEIAADVASQEPTAGYVDVGDDDTSPALASSLQFQGSVVTINPTTNVATFNFDGRYRRVGVTVPWSDIGTAGRPTTLSGYGITDSYTRTQLQTAGQSQLDAGNLTTGTLGDARLSSNIPRIATRNDWLHFNGITRAAGNDAGWGTQVTGDTVFRWVVEMSGRMEWGAGGTVARDTNLYRYAANALRTDDAFHAASFHVGTTEVITAARILTGVEVPLSLTTGTLPASRGGFDRNFTGLGARLPYWNGSAFVDAPIVAQSSPRYLQLATDGSLGFATIPGTVDSTGSQGGQVLQSTGGASSNLWGWGIKLPGNVTTSTGHVLRYGGVPSGVAEAVWGFVSYSELTDVPVTFAPAAHTQAYTTITGLTAGSLMVGTATTPSLVTAGAVGQVLRSTGTTWASAALALTDTTGTLTVSRGGTGRTTITSGNVLIGAGTSAVTMLAPGANRSVLIGASASAWESRLLVAADLPAHTHVSGDIVGTIAPAQGGFGINFTGLGAATAYWNGTAFVTLANSPLPTAGNLKYYTLASDGTIGWTNKPTGTLDATGTTAGQVVQSTGAGAQSYGWGPIFPTATGLVGQALIYTGLTGGIPTYIGGNVSWSYISGAPVYTTRWPTFAEVTSKPTTLGGFGITDAYTSTVVNTLLAGKSDVGHTHAAQDINSGNFNTRLGWEVPFTRGSASAILAVGYNVAGTAFNNASLDGALVLTTAIGTGLGNNMFTIKIVGRIHTGATNIELLVSGYQTSVGGIANASITANHRDFNYPVRLGFNAAGFLCVIIGGTSDTWSYPRLYVPYASIGYSAGSARGAQFEGWGFSAVTDLTGYTTLTPLTDESNAQYLNAQPASYYLDAGNLTGNLADARLSSNIPRLNATNEFTNWLAVRRSLVTEAGMAVWITGDTTFRWRVLAGGDIQWGPGTGAVYDTNLYRSAANTLRTDDTFSAFSFQIAGSTVINSSSQLVNVTASAAILTSGFLDINLIPSGISRVGHTHDVTDFYGSISVANGGTGRSSVTAGALLVGNPVGGSNPMQEVLPGADGGFLVSWSGTWTRQSGVQWTDISSTGRPTTLAGYGITDAAPLAHGHEVLSPVSDYTYGAATAPRLFPQNFLYSFVRNTDGWPMTYGRLIHFGSYTSGQDGAAFQILAPYSTGASYNSGKPMWRSGVYSNAGWTVWYTFASEAWATATFEPKFTTLGVSKGGTGRATLTTGNVLVGAGTGQVGLVAPIAAGRFLRASSASAWGADFITVGDLPTHSHTEADLPTTHNTRNIFNGGIRLPDGTGAAPSLAVGQDDLGFWRYTTNGLGLAGILYVTRNIAADWNVGAQANSAHPAYMGDFGAPYTGFAAWWRGGNAHYTILADASNAYLNANSATGFVAIRQGNADIARLDGDGIHASTGWFRNTLNGRGLYNQANSYSWYADSTVGRWVSRSGSGIQLRDTSDVIRGWVHFDATDFGLLYAGGGWALRSNVNETVLYAAANTSTYSATAGAFVMNKTTDSRYPYIDWTYGGVRGAYMGWGTPGSQIHLTMNTGVVLHLIGNNGAAGIATFAPSSVSITPNVTVSGYVTASTFYTSSSRQFKFDIREFNTSALDILKQTRILRFRYRDHPDEQQVGFMAEDAPELFVTRDRLRMKSSSVISVVIAGVQELEERVASLETENAQLRARMARMN